MSTVVLLLQSSAHSALWSLESGVSGLDRRSHLMEYSPAIRRWAPGISYDHRPDGKYSSPDGFAGIRGSRKHCWPPAPRKHCYSRRAGDIPAARQAAPPSARLPIRQLPASALSGQGQRAPQLMNPDPPNSLRPDLATIKLYSSQGSQLKLVLATRDVRSIDT